MEKDLINLYNQCVNELKTIGIDVNDKAIVGDIDIKLTTRASKRYGCCKQENPDKSSKIIEKHGYRYITKYEKFNKHHIEVSSWVMQLNNDIIKNTIMHELIHCFPYCNNHGQEFKKYAKYINQKLGYNITRVGNVKEDYEESNIPYQEKQYKYKIVCEKCGQEIYRNRLSSKLLKRYRCGKCGGKLKLSD
jgi:predicted SprT family Zn-dependent metalloprotease